jgi:hypothetical protein
LVDLMIDDTLSSAIGAANGRPSPLRSMTGCAPAARPRQQWLSCACPQAERPRLPSRVPAQFLRTRKQHAELPFRFAQFKRKVNRGMLRYGGCVSAIELAHLDLYEAGMFLLIQS